MLKKPDGLEHPQDWSALICINVLHGFWNDFKNVMLQKTDGL